MWRRVRWGNLGLLAGLAVGAAMLLSTVRGGGGAEREWSALDQRPPVETSPPPSGGAAPRLPTEAPGLTAAGRHAAADGAPGEPGARMPAGRAMGKREPKRAVSEQAPRRTAVPAPPPNTGTAVVQPPREVVAAAAPSTAPVQASGEFMPDPGSAR